MCFNDLSEVDTHYSNAADKGNGNNVHSPVIGMSSHSVDVKLDEPWNTDE